MSDGIYYDRPVLLDRAKHRRLRVQPGTSFAFARRANSVTLTAVEFNEATHLVAMHLASLSNLKRLADRLARRAPALQPAPKPA